MRLMASKNASSFESFRLVAGARHGATLAVATAGALALFLVANQYRDNSGDHADQYKDCKQGDPVLNDPV